MRIHACLTALLVSLYGQAASQIVTPTKVHVNGVNLHFIEQGHGEPLILLHGAARDYSSWQAQLDSFSRYYRVISYSRRYNYPNNNPITAENHSANIEAEDLTAFIRERKLDRVHLVGLSYGAFTALAFAVQHPEMVKSLVLVEPPVHQWVKDVPGGEILYKEFMTNVWEPVTKAFQQRDTVQAMKIFVNSLSSTRTFDHLVPEARSVIMRNARAIGALARSSEPFPDLSKSMVRKLHIPSLIVTGENTIKIHKLVNEELARLLPNAKKVVIPNAGHGSPRDNPDVFNGKVLDFLAGVGK
jgi:non-heme chloroperoxidase